MQVALGGGHPWVRAYARCNSSIIKRKSTAVALVHQRISSTVEQSELGISGSVVLSVGRNDG